VEGTGGSKVKGGGCGLAEREVIWGGGWSGGVGGVSIGGDSVSGDGFGEVRGGAGGGERVGSGGV
jgi:hypothetical protein